MHHLGDQGGEEEDGEGEEEEETFRFRLTETNPDVEVVAVVINVATDGDTLTDVVSSGMRLCREEEGAEPEVEFQLALPELQGCELLLGLLFRSKEDKSNWRLVSVGELVQGPERDEEESQNFMNAAPLAQHYLREHGLCLPPDDDTRRAFNPFKMIPGDSFEVPALALDHPIIIGMGWDVDDGVTMDLDCGLAVYSSDQRTDYCDFEKLETNDGACQHQGDNRDGEGDGDDEQIIVHFTKLDSNADVLFLYAAVYEGGVLKDVENVHIRMVTQRGGKLKEICRFSLDWLADVEEDTAVILAKISRTETGGYEFKTIGTTAHGRTIEELETRLQGHLQ
jgi:stress response protein SCP2